MSKWKTVGTLLGGALLGTAGVKILSSSDAKKVYTHVTAAVLRGADEVMKTATTLKENCEDIKADADDINEKRKEEARKKEIEDAKELINKTQEKIDELENESTVTA
ncbi:MAG: hypothetical protein E7271_10450 [Lachnospiraceae bacterium]|jgi:peptidoglycan hydrolase CwlO-like protein|nr:hypothetical protein [Lachnospiraceae bacterium]